MKRINDSEEKRVKQPVKRTQFPLSLFLLSMVLAAVMFAAAPGFVGYDNVPVPESDFDYHFNDASLLRVKVYQNGELYLNERHIENVGDLSRMIKSSLAGKEQRGKMVLLADKRVQYGKVAHVLGQVRRADVDSVFLEYKGRASVLEILSGKNTN